MSGLDDIAEMAVENLDSILDHFDIEYTQYEDRLSFPCPIHGSDNEESLSIWITGHSYAGNWRCFTNACEQEIVIDTKNGEEIERPRGNNIFGFIRGVLSVEYDRHVEYGEAIKWLKSFLGISEEKVKVTFDEEKRGFVKATNRLSKKRKSTTSEITRDKIRKSLIVPSQYFVGRGFKPETMDKYDVGFCESKGKEMFHRVVVPVYDDTYTYMVGCVGRTIQPECYKCGYHHYDNRPCPRNKIEKKWGQKWINNSGFNSASTLYNLWFAKNSIADTGCAILVEGQGDVWRLEEAGIHIGLGIFGDSLSDEQKIALDSSGAMNLIILTDSDEAGLKAREKIMKQCERAYNCIFVDLPKKDIGEMSVDEVKKFLEPVLEKVL